MAIQIAVASGKGGTGKTTVASNLFHSINTYKTRGALLVDCDVEEPNAKLFFQESKILARTTIDQEIPHIDIPSCTFCRKCADFCEFNAIVVIPPAGFAEINPSLCHSCGACLVACPSNAIHIQSEPIGTSTMYEDQDGNRLLEGRLKIGSAMQTMVIRTLKQSIPHHENIVILDAPPGSSCPVVETMADADYVVLVSEPTPFGLHDLKLMLALVRGMGKSHGVVVNKANLGNRDLYDYLEDEQVEILGEIPFSRSYASQYSKADLFSETPSEVQAAHQKILEKLSVKGLIP